MLAKIKFSLRLLSIALAVVTLSFTQSSAAIEAGITRFRPVVTTAPAMMIGMIPMAFGLGEGGEQNAPLGRVVIGGLVCAIVATLLFVPTVFSLRCPSRRRPGSLRSGPILLGER